MKRRVRKQNGYGNKQVDELARDVQFGFDGILDLTVHKVTLVWNPPVTISVPYEGGEARQVKPAVVMCPNALNLTDPLTLVTPGGAAFDWLGNSQARINDVSGLTVGEKYELTFVVVG